MDALLTILGRYRMYELERLGKSRYEDENDRTAKQIREAKFEEKEEEETGGLRGLVLKVTDVGLLPIVLHEKTTPPPQGPDRNQSPSLSSPPEGVQPNSIPVS